MAIILKKYPKKRSTKDLNLKIDDRFIYHTGRYTRPLRGGSGVRVDSRSTRGAREIRQMNYLGPILAKIREQRNLLTEQERKALGLPTRIKFSQRQLRVGGIAGLRARRSQQRGFGRSALDLKRKTLQAVKSSREALARQEAQARELAKRIR